MTTIHEPSVARGVTPADKPAARMNGKRGKVKDSDGAWLTGSPRVHIDKERLFEALENVSKFCKWFEEELTKRQFPGCLRE
jgi:hypothetical protein